VAGPLTVAGMAFCLATAAWQWVSHAQSAPFWMDEVLAVWLARMHDASGVLRANWLGGDTSPPAFHLVLHACFVILGGGRWQARLLPAVGIAVSASCLWRLLRPRGPAVAAVAVATLVAGPCLDYALLARPYALEVACMSLGALAWTSPSGAFRSRWRDVGVFLACAAAASLHAYGVLVPCALLAAEAARAARDGRASRRTVCALMASLAVYAAWSPILARFAAMAADDAASPGYYATPHPGGLVASYQGLFGIWSDEADGLVPVVAGWFLLAALMARSKAREPSALRRWRPADEDIAAAASLLVPLGAYMAATLVTHSFSVRYALPGAVGAAIVVARLAGAAPSPALASMAAVLCCGFFGWEHTPYVPPPSAVLRQAAEGRVIVSDPKAFFEAWEEATPALRERLLYVTAPPGTAPDDWTDERQLLRWKRIDPGLPVLSFQEWAAASWPFRLGLPLGRSAFSSWCVANPELCAPGRRLPSGERRLASPSRNALARSPG
jgi:hypothetical protein